MGSFISLSAETTLFITDLPMMPYLSIT